MIHLITVACKSARNFYLEQQYIPDFKSLMRTITSGRVLMISTKFQSDLFYCSEKPDNNSILKVWALYANTNLDGLDECDISTSIGDEESLSKYFSTINKLSTNWHQYKLYKKAFLRSFSNDQENHVARTVVGCDQYLIEHTDIERTPLIGSYEKINSDITKDTFSIAMNMMNNETLSN